MRRVVLNLAGQFVCVVVTLRIISAEVIQASVLCVEPAGIGGKKILPARVRSLLGTDPLDTLWNILQEELTDAWPLFLAQKTTAEQRLYA